MSRNWLNHSPGFALNAKLFFNITWDLSGCFVKPKQSEIFAKFNCCALSTESCLNSAKALGKKEKKAV